MQGRGHRGHWTVAAIARRFAALLTVMTLAIAPVAAQAGAEDVAPEPATGRAALKAGSGERYMVVAANPHAVAAGIEMIEDGGSAVDALIATQMLLNLVEPQSSGIGGGAFLLHYDAEIGRTEAYDGRETAPSQATPDLFLKPDGTPESFRDMIVGGRPVGAPGVLRMLEKAHRAHGRLPWARLFEPAIKLAEDGFEVSPRLHELIAAVPALKVSARTRAYFFTPDGEPLPVGHRLRNPELAATLRLIAAEGADAFYKGPLAARIVDTVRNAPVNPGHLGLDDLAAYQAKVREAVCRPYRQWRACGMPPPTSGGVTVLQILGLLEGFDLAALDPLSPDAAHLIAEASRLAFADRALYLADPDFVAVPVDGLLDPDYLAGRAMLIAPERAMGKAEAGTPPMAKAALAPARAGDFPSTSHVSIVDARGNAVSMTTSIESAFGSKLMVGGFLLNNQLTDFSFRPETQDGRAIANRVEARKRPRSSMSPFLVFDDRDRLALAVGSPGGSRIIGYVAQTILAVLDWGLSPAEAVALPHIVNRNGTTDLEAGTEAAALETALAARGHEVRVRDLNSGLHAIAVTYDAAGDAVLRGGADPRREGIVAGR